MRISSRLKLIAAAGLISLAALNASRAFAGGAAVVDVVRVINASAPGKEAQTIFNAFKTQTDAERAAYARSVAGKPDAIALVDKKDVEFNAKNNEEFSRLCVIVDTELRKAVRQWLGINGAPRGVEAVVSTSGLLGVSPKANMTDISGEVLALLNAAKVNFEK